MSTSSDLAAARYAQTQSITSSVVQAVQALWRDVTPDRILAAMQGETGRQILAAVIAGQLSAAQGAQAFVAGAMLAQGASTTTLGTLVPGALANIAADGRALSTLLYLPAITTAQGLAGGLSPEVAALRGLNQLALLVGTTIADTARTATQVAMTATPSCVRYVRVVKLPACSRCIILAGREYSYSTGFKRHPKCDCGMAPIHSDDEWRRMSSPDSLFKAMTDEQRRKAFGADAVKAMENGADMGQVVNSRRGMSEVVQHGKKIQVTSEGTTRRGIGAKAMDAGFSKQYSNSNYARSTRRRLTPSECLRQAEGDREHQVRLLRKNGYIT